MTTDLNIPLRRVIPEALRASETFHLGDSMTTFLPFTVTRGLPSSPAAHAALAKRRAITPKLKSRRRPRTRLSCQATAPVGRRLGGFFPATRLHSDQLVRAAVWSWHRINVVVTGRTGQRFEGAPFRAPNA